MEKQQLMDTFKDCEFIDEKIVIKSDLAKVISTVKNDYGFDILKEIAAVDHQNDGIELIYRLFSTENEEMLLISIYTSNHEMESVSKIFDSAVADEKEMYDMFGVKFIGNDELKRLYMPEGWQGNPLKKDYKESDERLSWND